MKIIESEDGTSWEKEWLVRLISYLSIEVNNAINDFDNCIYQYQKGWEDDAYNRLIGLQIYLTELRDIMEKLIDENWILLQDAEIASKI